MENREQKAQEVYMEFQLLEQHIKKLQKQLELVTHQLMELNTTCHSLDEFTNIHSGKEILVPLSSGIFLKASVKDASELLVNVGANVAIKKDIPSTKKLVQKQMEEMAKIQKQMMEEMEKMTNHAAQLEGQLQELVSES
ncbi:MAG: prefoldin subunit alpha [Nanoarchaeota archaeon]